MWRYITGDNNWVLVRDAHRENGQAPWSFIRRSALAADAEMPNYRTYGRRGTCADLGS
jgi:hypothetical protein